MCHLFALESILELVKARHGIAPQAVTDDEGITPFSTISTKIMELHLTILKESTIGTQTLNKPPHFFGLSEKRLPRSSEEIRNSVIAIEHQTLSRNDRGISTR